MISYGVYKIIHYLGIFSLVSALTALLARTAAGAKGPDGRDPMRKKLVAAHGTALFLVLLGGFGMLARLDVTHGLGLPGWIWVKLGIWTVLGGLTFFVKRKPELAGAAGILVPLMAVLAGWVALYKPV
jgi:hypothetical protein